MHGVCNLDGEGSRVFAGRAQVQMAVYLTGYSDWLVSVNHFRHLTEVMPVWKMPSMITDLCHLGYGWHAVCSAGRWMAKPRQGPTTRPPCTVMSCGSSVVCTPAPTPTLTAAATTSISSVPSCRAGTPRLFRERNRCHDQGQLRVRGLAWSVLMTGACFSVHVHNVLYYHQCM